MNEIEKMRIDVLESVTWKELCDGVLALDIDSTTDHLRSKGYHKQEWISVDERFPEEDTRVLVYLNIQKTDANIYTFFDTDRILNGKWVRWNKYISHWMPLPEPPKMKGGAE